MDEVDEVDGVDAPFSACWFSWLTYARARAFFR